MEVRLVRNKDGRLEIHCDTPPPTWPRGDKLLRHLKKQLRAHVTLRVRCPITDQAIWDLQIEGRKIIAERSDWGDITIYAEDPSDQGLIEKIAESLQREMK